MTARKAGHKGGTHGNYLAAVCLRPPPPSAPLRRRAGVFAPAIAQNKPLRIGILAPRSGIAAAPGLNGIRATQWAVENTTRKGGIGGRKVELVIEEESSPKDTIERFSKLVQQDKVDCVQGIVSSGVGLALGPVVEEARALTIYLGRHDAERRRRDDSRPALSVPFDRQRVRGHDGLAAHDQALERQVRQGRGHQPRLFLRPQQHGGLRRRCSSASTSSTRSSPSSGRRSAPWT